MPIDLYFPSLNGGVEQGLNDAGIETFEGEFQRHIVRECTQNALDAHDEEQVLVKIHLRRIAVADIPGLDPLRKAVASMRDYWHDDAKTASFCNKALEGINGSEITVLEVSDYGTTGLEGEDDDRRGSWYGLVRSGGVSIKSDDAAGAYGIGKNAPFAGSLIRTVFYSALSRRGEHAFQGVVKLATHLDARNCQTQSAGFIGVVDAAGGVCQSVRQPELIPLPFLRAEKGTSVFVVASRQDERSDWTDAFIREAVENFWPAIHRGKLVFQIGSTLVNATTLRELMLRYSSDRDFISRFYYHAVTNTHRIERKTNLPRLGACSLHLIAGDATYPKKVCMTRSTGMVIYEAARFRSYRPFAGLFVCDSPEGNTYLRKLEPPRHDKWDSTRSESPNEAKRTLQCIRDWINQCLRELNPDEDAREIDVPELNRYLPDDVEEPLDSDTEVSNQPRGEHGIISTPLTESLIIQELPTTPPARQQASETASPQDGQEEGEGAGGGEIDPVRDETEATDGQSDASGSGDTGRPAAHVVKTPLQTRSVRSAEQCYELFVRSAVDCKGRLVLVSVGEDNREEKDLRISSIMEVDSGRNVTLDQFSLFAGQVTHLRATIETRIPLSLRAYCHGD